jgi:hypothetical protein
VLRQKQQWNCNRRTVRTVRYLGGVWCSRIYTVYSSLRLALSFLSLLCLYQSSGNCFQRRTSPFLWVPDLTVNLTGTPSVMLHCTNAEVLTASTCPWLCHASEWKSCFHWRSVSQYVLVSSSLWTLWPDTRITFYLKVAVLSLWGALSDERSGLSLVSHYHHYLVHCQNLILFTFYMFLCMYYIYKASVSRGSVLQQQFRHLNGRTLDRRQVQASYIVCVGLCLVLHCGH